MVNGWKVIDVQYLHHKGVSSIAIENHKGDRVYVNVSDAAFEKHHTVYFSSDRAKENPQTEESVVGAGTDFLMKVTEEAVISGMILSQQNGKAKVRNPKVRDVYRRTAEDITLEEVKRFVEFDQQDDSPFTFRPSDSEKDDTETRAAHGVPSPPRILPADRYAPETVIRFDSPEEYEKYLDATQGK